MLFFCFFLGGGVECKTLQALETMGPPKPTFLEVFMVDSLVFRWPKPLFFMVLGAYERSGRSRSVMVFISI